MKYDIYFGDGNVRFALGKSGKKPLVIIGVNPSTADAYESDPTITKVEKLASAWDYDGFLMLNLYPVRESNPKNLVGEFDVGLASINSEIVGMLLKEQKPPVIWAAWGNAINLNKEFVVCLKDLAAALKDQNPIWLQCGNLTDEMNPRHPNPRESFVKTFKRGLSEFILKSYLNKRFDQCAKQTRR